MEKSIHQAELIRLANRTRGLFDLVFVQYISCYQQIATFMAVKLAWLACVLSKVTSFSSVSYLLAS